MGRAAFLGRLRIVFKVISWVAVVPLVASAALTVAMLSEDRAAFEPTFVNSTGDILEQAGLARWQFLTWAAAIVALLFAALVWLAWIYFATRFLRIVGVEPPRYGPLSAVALHFLPIVAHVMPMVIMSELERVTRDPLRWRDLPANWLPATSWLAGRLSLTAMALTGVFQERAQTPHQYSMALWLMVLATVGCAGGVYLFNRFLSRMQRLQMVLAVKITEEQAQGHS
ncbi:DUF4328 domain-containing protein [Rhizobium sp. TH2]|uniref:DUF4328 domain-containing protein n=1 Tax=Rhizobium sp. TH2 TaxID=2775403 RepID=UPI002157C55F|nr:DUF4328 domain-containing protein [Rhizobium sp. TH2]UVC10026.1 DUF4328 domain-containing protein [Rhizobium sp. TH2]